MANGGRLRGGLGGIPGLGGYLGGRQLNRERQAHNLNMRNQQQVMRQRQQQIEALKREAEEYEANERRRQLRRQAEELQLQDQIEDQPERDRLEDAQRQLETRETMHTLENWEEMKARERQQALLDMEEQRADIEGTRASAAESRGAAASDYASARDQRIESRQNAVDLLAASIPDDPSSMTQRQLSRTRTRASEMGLDPDDLGLPQRVGSPQAQSQLRHLQSRSTQARQQRREVEQIWERQRAELWRAQEEYERDIGNNDYSPTQLTKLMEERDRKQSQLEQARENGNTELASQLESDLEHYNNRITRLSAESQSRSNLITRIYNKIINGEGITPEEKSVLEVESLLGNPMAQMQSQMIGSGAPGSLDQYVRERDEESPGQQQTTQGRADDAPRSPRYEEDDIVQLPEGPARFGRLVDMKMEMDENLSRQQARRQVTERLNRERQNME